MRRLRVLALFCIGLAACGDDGAPAAEDAATDAADGGSIVPLPPAPPAAAEAPAETRRVDLRPCPSGWVEATSEHEGGATWCVPAGPPIVACDPGSARVPGDEACLPLASCATADGFSDAAPSSGDVRFVRPGATGGDGSRATPFGTLSDALLGAAAGTTLALSVGTHAGGVELPAGVVLLGVCPETTLVMGPSDAAAITVAGAGVSMEGVSLRGASTALVVARGAELTMRGAELTGGTIVQGSLTLDRVGLRDGVVAVRVGGAVTASDVHGADAGLSVEGGTLDLERAALAGGEVAVSVSAGTATLAETSISGGAANAIVASGADVVLEVSDLLVTDARAVGGVADGIVIDEGATLRAERTSIVRPGGTGLVGFRSELELRDVVVVDTGLDSESNVSGGVRFGFGAHVEAAGLSVEGPRSIGLTFFQVTGYIEDLRVLDVENVDTNDGVGIASGSSHVAIRRGLVDGARLTGIMASDPESQLRLEDVRIADVTTASGAFGRGLSTQSGAKIIVRRVAIESATADGIFATSRSASIVGSDVVVSGIQPARSGPLVGIGIGIHVQNSAFIDLTRVEVRDSSGFGMVILGEGTKGRVRDVVVEGTTSWDRPPLEQTNMGRGIDVEADAVLVIERARIADNRDVGIAVSPNAVLTLSDVEIRDTRDDGSSREGGRGLAIYAPATVRGQRLLVENNRDVGVIAYEEGTTLDLEDLVIRGTVEAACAPDGCNPGGIGLGAYDSSAVTVRRFLIENNLLAGVQVAEGASLDLSDGVVRGSPIGASVDVDGYDVERLSNNVRYEDNGTNLDSTTLPIPARGATIDTMGEM